MSDDLRARIEELRAHDLPTKGGTTLAYVYDSGLPDVDAVAREALVAFADSNGLDPTAFPSLLRMENELVGFAAETGEGGLDRAREKLTTKQVDFIVYNDVSREDVGFDTQDNEVVIVSAESERRVDKAPKDEIAAAILDEVEHRL